MLLLVVVLLVVLLLLVVVLLLVLLLLVLFLVVVLLLLPCRTHSVPPPRLALSNPPAGHDSGGEVCLRNGAARPRPPAVPGPGARGVAAAVAGAGARPAAAPRASHSCSTCVQSWPP